VKAFAQRAYGGPEVLVMIDLAKPVPKENEVMVKIHAVTVSSGDARIRAFKVPALFWLPGRLVMGITKPRKSVLGGEFSGVIEAVGGAVKRFKVGDAIYGMHLFDVHAEYKCIPETGAIALKPDSLSFEQAAAIPFGSLTALHFLRAAQVSRGQKVLINGASGSVGTAAIQIARHFGAEVTAVCSAANAELVKSLGAQHVIDYKAQDFTRAGETYDVIFDTVGTTTPGKAKRALKPEGKFLAALTRGPELGGMILSALGLGPKVVTGMATEKLEDLRFLSTLMASGELVPVIDRTFPFEQLPEAHALVDTGRKRGNVVVKVAA
jgi:NADPH:quinone reductase-like Zn-dependent oxidoreductase